MEETLSSSTVMTLARITRIRAISKKRPAGVSLSKIIS
jgi:hypothetical protein